MNFNFLTCDAILALFALEATTKAKSFLIPMEIFGSKYNEFHGR